jgi:hypothetical protein
MSQILILRGAVEIREQPPSKFADIASFGTDLG